MFQGTYDTDVRSCVKNGKSVEEFLDSDNVKVEWGALKTMVVTASISAASPLDPEEEVGHGRPHGRMSISFGHALPAESAAVLTNLTMASLESVH